MGEVGVRAGKVSLGLSILVWLIALAGVLHCSFLSNELATERSIMTPATMCSVMYFQPIWIIACLAFVTALLGLIFEGRSKLIYVSLVLSGIIAVPVSLVFIKQAML
jgi:hypothetical protein